MAAAVSAAVSLPSSESTSLPAKTSITSPESINNNNKVPLYYRNVSAAGAKIVQVRAEVATEAPAKAEKVSKRAKDWTRRCLLNTKITGDDAPGETWHMVSSTEDTSPTK